MVGSVYKADTRTIKILFLTKDYVYYIFSEDKSPDDLRVYSVEAHGILDKLKRNDWELV